MQNMPFETKEAFNNKMLRNVKKPPKALNFILHTSKVLRNKKCCFKKGMLKVKTFILSRKTLKNAENKMKQKNPKKGLNNCELNIIHGEKWCCQKIQVACRVFEELQVSFLI